MDDLSYIRDWTRLVQQCSAVLRACTLMLVSLRWRFLSREMIPGGYFVYSTSFYFTHNSINASCLENALEQCLCNHYVLYKVIAIFSVQGERPSPKALALVRIHPLFSSQCVCGAHRQLHRLYGNSQSVVRRPDPPDLR